jgi:membrane-associated phospholipid phosphatase
MMETGFSYCNLHIFRMINGAPLGQRLSLLLLGFSQNLLVHQVLLAWPCVYVYFRERGRRDQERRLVLALAGAACAVATARLLAHALPFSVRPMFDPTSGFRSAVADYQPDMERWSSFPSDTAALCAAMTLGLSRLAPRVAIVAFTASLVVIVAPRIYFGLHWPADVAVGLSLGVIWARIAQELAEISWPPMRWLSSPSRCQNAILATMFLALVSTAELFDGPRDLWRILKSVGNAPQTTLVVIKRPAMKNAL